MWRMSVLKFLALLGILLSSATLVALKLGKLGNDAFLVNAGPHFIIGLVFVLAVILCLPSKK